MLLHNKDQMESYYRQVARHIREIDETRILLEESAKFLAGTDTISEKQIERNKKNVVLTQEEEPAAVTELTVNKESRAVNTASPESRTTMSPKQMKAYLARLKKQYEALGEVFFCNDFAVDSVLYDFVIRCRKEGIKTDILFHEYQRGEVAAEDAAAILSRMLDYGMQAAQPSADRKINANQSAAGAQAKTVQTVIGFHGASVKNQLIFSMTVARQEREESNEKLPKIRIRKRFFNPWMRKYNGIMHVQREEKRLQMVVGLENGEKQ